MTKLETPFGAVADLSRAAFQPITSMGNLLQGWFHNVNFSVFGSNIQDREVETHVLDNVGSYGKQLNVVLDAMVALIERLERQPHFTEHLTQEEHHDIWELKELARAADTASRSFRGLPPREARSKDELDAAE